MRINQTSRNVNVVLDGPLFHEPNVIENRVIKPAIKETLDVGLTLVRSLTPVNTGNLQDGWFNDYSKGAIVNEVPYALFVEEGTRYMDGRNMAGKAADRLVDVVSEAIAVYVSAIA